MTAPLDTETLAKELKKLWDILPATIDLQKYKARLAWTRYRTLKSEGFTHAETMELLRNLWQELT